MPTPDISRPNTEPLRAGGFCIACNEIPGDTDVVVTRAVGLDSCFATVTGAGGLTVCSVKSPASAPSLPSSTGVSVGAAGEDEAGEAALTVCEVRPGVDVVVAADVSPGSVLVDVVVLTVVTVTGCTNSCVTTAP